LEVRYTYRADEAESAGEKKEYKTFTFWVRVNLGKVEGGISELLGQ